MKNVIIAAAFFVLTAVILMQDAKINNMAYDVRKLQDDLKSSIFALSYVENRQKTIQDELEERIGTLENDADEIKNLVGLPPRPVITGEEN